MHRLGEAEREIELMFRLSLGTIATPYWKPTEIRVHESAHRANVGVGFAGFFNLLDVQSTVFFRDGHEGKYVHGDFTPCLSRDVVSGQRVADALNDLNRNLSNSIDFSLLG